MPTYEYECTKCGHVFEMFQNITAKPKRKPDEPCAGCGERAPIRRLLGAGGAVIFKGSGFYQTDYRNESYKKAAAADKTAASGGSDSGDSSKKTDKAGAKGKETTAKDTSSKNTTGKKKE